MQHVQSYSTDNTLSSFLATLLRDNVAPLLSDEKLLPMPTTHVSLDMPVEVAEEIVAPVSGIERPSLPPLPEWLRGSAVDLFLADRMLFVQNIARKMYRDVRYTIGYCEEDLVQEGLIVVWQCIEKYDAKKSPTKRAFETYTLICAKFTMLQYIYKMAQDNTYSLEKYLSVATDNGKYTRELPTAHPYVPPTMSQDECDRVHMALGQLLPHERIAVMAFFGIENEDGISFSLQEIREKMGVERKLSNSWKCRALKKMRKVLVHVG